MKRIFIIIFSITAFIQTQAQQDPMYTHYMYNTLSVNPAYAGSRDALTATILNRSQWVSFPGAPKTQSVTIHSPVVSGINLGLDLMFDRIGPLQISSYVASYAYRFNLTENSRLSFGVSTGFKTMNINYSNMQFIDANDPAFASLNAKTDVNVGFGAYYSTDRFYAGISTPGLLQKTYSTDGYDIGELNEKQRHFFVISGAMIPISAEWNFKPTGLLKIAGGTPMQLDLSGQLVFLNRFEMGLMYRTDLKVTEMLRTGDGLGVLAGFDLLDNLYLGYSYDYSFANPTRYANEGSHELILRYDLIIKDKNRVRSPRYF